MTTRFEWDPDKDAENQRKHGVGFQFAQEVFLDPNVVIGILTVRFTYRTEVIRIIGAGYWRKGKRIYEQKDQIHE